MLINFDRINKNRLSFLDNNKDKDYVVLNGNNNILLSCPHGVSQVRLGKNKCAEIGSLNTGLYLQNITNSWLIAKTKNNCDDANFDEVSAYKNEVYNLIDSKGIKYFIDFHGLARSRDCDINLCTHLGNNISTNIDIFNSLVDLLEKNNFIVNIDSPFMANSQTLSSCVKSKFQNVWSLQIEINCAITNESPNFTKYKKLLDIFTDWLKNIDFVR